MSELVRKYPIQSQRASSCHRYHYLINVVFVIKNIVSKLVKHRKCSTTNQIVSDEVLQITTETFEKYKFIKNTIHVWLTWVITRKLRNHRTISCAQENINKIFKKLNWKRRNIYYTARVTRNRGDM